MKNSSSEKIGSRQKTFFFFLLAGCFVLVVLVVLFTESEKAPQQTKFQEEASFDTVSQEVDSKTIRLSALEHSNDDLNGRLAFLEKSLVDLKCENQMAQEEKEDLEAETQWLKNQVMLLEEEVKKPLLPEPKKPPVKNIKIWSGPEKKEGRHVSFEIPAGTVVKAILVSGADCSVAVQKPTGPNMVLLRPLDNGNLPHNVRVPLKGSVIVGNAIGDISSERVYIRAERMSLVERGGSFVETELSAYVSGEDGREGMRGVVVDRSGQIVARAAFSAFVQGAGQAAEAALNLKALEKDDKAKYILGNGMFQGGSTALNKMADYYIKRAEQLQPAIQIAAGRVVDIVFTKSVKVGEKDLKKKFDMERAAKRGPA